MIGYLWWGLGTAALMTVLAVLVWSALAVRSMRATRQRALLVTERVRPPRPAPKPPRVPRDIERLLIPYQYRDIRIESISFPRDAAYYVDLDGTLHLEARGSEAEIDAAIAAISAELGLGHL